MAEIAGLTLITPSSVAGSGVSLSGAKVVFTSSATFSVNGVFSATHDNYLMVMRYNVSTNNPFAVLRYRVSGTDASGSNYVDQYLLADNTSVGANRNTRTYYEFAGGDNDGPNGAHVYFYGPALAQPTAARSVEVNSLNGARIIDHAGTHSLSTAYDGFTVLGSSATNFTGSLTVYGLSQ